MKIEWKTCFKVGISVILVYLVVFYIKNLQGFFSKAIGAAIPLIVGCVLAYVINILMSFYEKHYFPYTKKKFLHKTRRPVCLLLAVLSLIGIVVLIISLILPQLTSCVQLIIAQIPSVIENIIDLLDKWDFVPQKILEELSAMDLQERMGEIIEKASSYFGNMVNILFNVITGVFSVAFSALLGIIFALYLLLAKDKLGVHANKLIDSYCKPKLSRKIRYITRVLDESFHNYIVGQSTEAVILGLLCMIGMMILGLPYSAMIGALVAFTALIPVVGAYVGAIVGAFMISTVSLMDALIFIIFLVILQQIEGNLIYPKVVGTSLGLPGIWVLAAVTIGGGVMGIPGMLIGVPLAAAIYRILRHDVRKRIRKFNEQKEHEEELKNDIHNGEAEENDDGAVQKA